MWNNGDVKKLKKNIETKRDYLNMLMNGNYDKDKILKFSMELDKLIYEYYKLEDDNNEKARL